MKVEQGMKINRPLVPRPPVSLPKVFFIISAILLLIFLLILGAYLLIPKQVLTHQIQTTLQKSLQKNNLQIEIAEIHFSLGKGVSGTGIRLKELGNGPDLIQADEVNLKLNLWKLLMNSRRPEASLREIEIIKPRMTIERLSDNFWNFQRYFGASNDALQFNTMIRIRNGLIKYRDFQYGSCEITSFNGKINLIQYPLIRWSVDGKAKLDLPVSLSCQGETRIDQTAGNMKVLVRGSSLPQLLCYLPRVIDCRAVSGVTDINLQFAWGDGSFWLENGKAVINNANIYLPYFPNPFRITNLETFFTPERFQIKTADLAYNQTTLKLQGVFNPHSTEIKGALKVEGLNLADFRHLAPELKTYGIEGVLDLNLKINGRISAPVLDGALTIKDGKVGLSQGEFIERISGRVAMLHNKFIFQHFQGFWRQSPLELTGTIENIPDPSLNLIIKGKELNLNRLDLLKKTTKDWQIGNQVDFQVGITGSPLKPNLKGTLFFDEFRYQGLLIQRVQMDFGWDNGAQNLRTDIKGEIGAGRLNAQGTVRFDQQMVEWSISGALSDLNLDQFNLGPDLKLTGKISASIVSQGNWRQGEPVNFGNVFGTFRGEKLNFKNYTVDQVDGVLSWNSQKLTIDSFQAKIGPGRLFGSLSFKDNYLVADFDIENLQLGQLPIEREKIPLDGILDGNVAFEGPLAGLKGKINGAITGLAWGSQRIGDFTGSLSYADNVLNILNLNAVTAAGNFNIQGSLTVGKKPEVKLNLVSTNTSLAGVLKWLPLDPNLKIDGSGKIKAEIVGSLDSPSFRGEISLLNPQVFNLKMKEGFIQFEGSLTEIKIQKFSLRNDSSYLELSGQASREAFDVNITGQSLDLAILQLEFGGKSLQGTVNLNGRLAGSVEDPVLTGGITGRDLQFGSLFYPEMTGRIKWNKAGLEILEAGLRQGQSAIDVKGRILSSNPMGFDLEAKVQNFNLQDLKQFVPFPAGLDLAGQLNGNLILTGTIQQPSIQVMGDLTQGKVNAIPVTGEFNLFYSNSRIILNQIRLRQGEGTLLVRGVWENNQSLKIQIQIMNFPLEVFNAFFKLPFTMGGVVNSQIDLEWSVERVIGRYQLDGTAFTLNQDSLGDFQLAGVISEAGVTVDEGSLTGKNGSILMNGYLPWPKKLPNELGLPTPKANVSREMDFNLILKQVAGTLLNHYLQNVTVHTGVCNGQLQVNGDLTRPLISGALNGKDFKVEIGGLPFPLEVPQVDVSIDANRILLQKMKGVYGSGKFTLAGEGDLNNFKELSFKINATGTKIYYRNQFFDGFGDLNLNLEGTLKKALLSGSINVYDNKVGVLGIESGGPILVEWSPNLDLEIKTGNNCRCRVIGFADLAIKGAIRIKGTLAAPAIEGEVTSKSGVLTFYNNAFRINEGKAVFKYAQGFNPYVELDAGLRKSKVEVFLNINGMVDQLDIHLSSQPYLSQTELYSLLNWSQLHGDAPLTPQDVVTGNISVLTDTLLGDFLSYLGQSLNIDYLYLEPDKELKGYRISVGNYVSDQLFLSYSQSIFNSDQAYLWGLDYYLTPNWVLGYNYSIQEGASWELAYRIKF